LKYPLEIEFTNFCSLRCKVCINKDFIQRWNISFGTFQFILDYIDRNKEEILYVNFAWIGDIFMHPQINQFLKIFQERFKWSGIQVLIPTKGQKINLQHILFLKKLQKSEVKLNVNVWFYSFSETIQNEMSWWKSFSKMLYFLTLLKKFRIPFSIELISNKLDEYRKLQKYASYFWCWYSLQNFHNFSGRIKGENFAFNKCSFDRQDYKIQDAHCSFIPFIDFSGNVYPCSISSWTKELCLWNIKQTFQDFPHYLDLVNYIKNSLTKEKCIQCSLYNNYEKKAFIWDNNNKSV